MYICQFEVDKYKIKLKKRDNMPIRKRNEINIRPKEKKCGH